jgi:hypothetical protein
MLTAAGLDGVTVDGTNQDLVDPIADALRRLGAAPADLSTVGDADLAGLDASRLPALLDLAELRALETVLGNLTAVDLRLGPRDEKFSQLPARLETRIARLQRKVESEHGISSVSSGVISLDFAEHNEDLP